MLEKDEIQKYIKDSRFEFVIDFRIRAHDEAVILYVPFDRVAEKVKSGFTSAHQLRNYKSRMSDFFSTEIIIVFVGSESHSDLEAGFFQMLNRRYKGKVVSLYISYVSNSSVVSWVEVRGQDESLKEDISNYLSKILLEVNLSLKRIHWVCLSESLPTNIVILRLVKVFQPVSLSQLLESLQKNYHDVDDKWLLKTLDNLRKKRMLRWQRPGNYTLTTRSLMLVPAGARRSSSDIDRALALARRRW